MALALLRVAAALYAVAAAAGVLALIRQTARGARFATAGLFVALIAHALALGGRTVEVSAFPMASLQDGLSLFCFLVALIAIGVSWRGGVPQAAVFAAPLVAVVMALTAIVEPRASVPDAFKSLWLAVHIGLALLGDAALAIAGVVSIVYLVHEHRLKSKSKKHLKSGEGLWRLPALEVLDAVSVKLIKWGFPLMTLGLISGALYGKHVWGRYWTWDPGSTVSLLVWVLYAVMIHARLMIGWRGRKAAILTLVGVIAILVAFVGLGLAGIGIHAKDYLS